MKLTNCIGWLMALLFAFCALPQTIQSITNKSSGDISIAFLSLWLAAEILGIIYIIRKFGFEKPLLFNYIVNAILILPILYYAII